MWFMFVVQIDTMKCFYCPQKDTSLVPRDSLSPADQTFLPDKYPDASQGAVCDLCVRAACPISLFSPGSGDKDCYSGNGNIITHLPGQCTYQ